MHVLAIAKLSLKLGILLCNRHPDPLQQSCSDLEDLYILIVAHI